MLTISIQWGDLRAERYCQVAGFNVPWWGEARDSAASEELRSRLQQLGRADPHATVTVESRDVAQLADDLATLVAWADGEQVGAQTVAAFLECFGPSSGVSVLLIGN